MGKKKKQEKQKKQKEKEEKLLRENKIKKKAGKPGKSGKPGKEEAAGAKPEKVKAEKRKPEGPSAAREAQQPQLQPQTRPQAQVSRRPKHTASQETGAAAELFRALGDENRLQILALLKGREICAADLLGSLSIVQSTLSHHMKVLTETGIVRCRKQGKWSYYSINREKLSEIHGLMQNWD